MNLLLILICAVVGIWALIWLVVQLPQRLPQEERLDYVDAISEPSARRKS